MKERKAEIRKETEIGKKRHKKLVKKDEKPSKIGEKDKKTKR